MSSAVYLMKSDFGDLAYPIALIIMSIAASVAGHFKKKKKQEQLGQELDNPNRPPAKARPTARGLEELMEVLLPPEAKAAARGKKPPQVESPLRRSRRAASTEPAPPRARPARPAQPPTRTSPAKASRQAARTFEDATLAPPARRISYLPARLSVADLRRAVLLNEILDKPLALREPRDF